MRRFSLVACALAVLPWTPTFRLAPPVYIEPPKSVEELRIPLDQYEPMPSERRCTREEKRMCVSACGGGALTGPTFKVPSSCRVRTIDSVLTAVCTCVDPNLEV